LIHRGVEIVFVKRFRGIQAAGFGQPRAVSALGQGQLGTGKEDAAVNHGLEKAPLARRTETGEDLVEVKAGPSVVEDGKAAVVESLVELNALGREESLALEGSGNEIAGRGREVGDVADGAGAGAVRGAEGFANEVGDVVLAVLAGGTGGLHEHGLHPIPMNEHQSTQ